MAPPQPNEFELSLFGPGIGECCVVHLGAGEWITIDSCLAGDRSTPIALEYLDGLGVSVASQLKLIVVSHWHDDHIKGVADLFSAAVGARFACSGALQNKEFMTLLLAGQRNKLKPLEESSSVDEFSRVLQLLTERRGGKRISGPDHWASSDSRLLSTATEYPAVVTALSPSAQSITDAMGEMRQLIPKDGSMSLRFAAVKPNDCSVALLIEFAGFCVLLGADLERGRDDRRGWRAVVASGLRPLAKSAAYKVAHHGSENADLEDMWTHFIEPSPHAILAPYGAGAKPLPSPEDVDRLRTRTSDLYSTVWPITQAPPKRLGVDSHLNSATRSRRAIRNTPGHIRLRKPLTGGDFSIELMNGASRL